MPAPSRPAPRFPDLLIQNRNFLLLWAAYGISAFGDHLSELALLETSGGMAGRDSMRVKALMTFCFFLPFAVLGPVAGWWADRFSRKWTMISADMIRAGIMVTLPLTVPLLYGLHLGDWSVSLPLLWAGTFAALFSPARQAMVPTLIRDDQLVRANALISALGTIGAILSGVLGGTLVDLSRAGKLHLYWNYRLDALTFLISATLVSMIALSRSRAVPHELAPGIWTPVRQGFRYVWSHRRVLQVILLATVFWAVAGVVDAAIPSVVHHVFHGSYAFIGIYRGLIAGGLAGGAALLTVLGASVPLPLVVLVSLLGGAFWLALLDVAYIHQLGRALPAVTLVMLGVHGAGMLITATVVIQRFVPDARQGRVFGVSDMSTMTAIVVATGLLGVPDIPNLDTYIPLLFGAMTLGLLLAALCAWREYRRGDPHSALVWILWRLVRFYAAFWCRVERVGPCTIPRRGPVILAANHTSGVDPLLILGTCPHRLVSFLVERAYYRMPARWLMRLDGCVPVDRASPGPSFLRAALGALERGGCLGVFPQGSYVGPDEPAPQSRPGVGLLALRSGAAIVPCHIGGTRYTQHPLRSLFLRHHGRVRYGRPIDVSSWRTAAGADERQAARALTDEVMQAIRALGPESEA